MHTIPETQRFAVPRIAKSWLFALALAACPFLSSTFGATAGYHDNQRMLEAVALTLAACVVMQHLFAHGSSRVTLNKRILSGLGLFFLLGLVSSMNSYSPRHAFHELSSFLLLFSLATVVAYEVASGEDSLMAKTLVICGIGCQFYLFHATLIYIAFISGGAQADSADLVFGFDNYRFFNHTQTISLPILCLLTARSERHGRQYWMWFLTAVIWWAMLYLTAGRGTFLGIVSGLIITWILRRNASSSWIRIVLSTAVVGAFAYLIFFMVLPLVFGLKPFGFLANVVERTVANPTSSRTGLWLAAIEMMSRFPLLGAGPLHFAHYGAFLDNAAHPHNWFLQITAEWGIPAALLFAGVIGKSFHSLLKAAYRIPKSDKHGQATHSAWLTIGAAIIVDGLVSGLIVMPASQLWIALYVGCAWGWVSALPLLDSAAKYTSQTKTGMSKAFVGAAVMLFAAGLYWNALFPEILDLRSFENDALKTSFYPSGIFRPRIWLAGFF